MLEDQHASGLKAFDAADWPDVTIGRQLGYKSRNLVAKNAASGGRIS